MSSGFDSGTQDLLYLDHASTAWPRPACVLDTVKEALTRCGNPGRSGHVLAMDGARIVYRARTGLAALLGITDSRRVLFTGSCTEALNLVIRGVLRAGDHVLASSMEHNSAARPLRALEQAGLIELSVVPCDDTGRLDPDRMRAARRKATRLAVICHASNVSGTVQDLGRLREELAGLPLLVDAAQTAGSVPIDVDRLGIEYLAVSGHKGLMGPQGVGGLFLGLAARLPESLVSGGTGSHSERDVQPDFLPDRYESGSPNLPGIAGLGAGVEQVSRLGIEGIGRQDRRISLRFLEQLRSVSGVRLVGSASPDGRLATFSLVFESMDGGLAARILEQEYGILVRSGLHCAPWAHRTLATLPQGTVRFAFSPQLGEEAVDRTCRAIRELSARGHRT